MGYSYSAATGGFYHSAVHGAAIPADAVAVSDAEHAALLDGQRAGSRIVAGPDGRPTLTAEPLALAPPDGWVPATVTRLQARLCLLNQPAPAGSGYPHLWGWLEDWAADPARSESERAYFEDAQTWRRDDPLVAAVTAALGLDDEAVDGLFRAAAEPGPATVI